MDKVLENTADLATAYSQYFSDHLQGKSVITKIGKVWINGETKKEVRKDLDKIKLLTVPYIPEILIKGDVGEPVPNKDLGNPKKPKKQKYESFIPFTRTIHIKNIAIETTIQVGKLFNGGQLSYSLNAKEMQFDSLFADNKKPNSENAPIEKSWYQTSQVGYDKIMPQSADDVNIDEMNIEIVRISDEMGRELTAGEAVALLFGVGNNEQTTQNPRPFDRSQITIPKSKNARQNANNQAIAILNRLDNGEMAISDLSDDDKAALAKYSGNGGGLIGADGKKGSDYEYYTPQVLASGMWDLAKELGFSGGRVLDPCAGTGVFTATSPDNVIMDNIELDETSGRINQILTRFNGITANFEFA